MSRLQPFSVIYKIDLYSGKVVPTRHIKAYGGSRGIDPFILNLGITYRWLSGQLNAPTALPSEKANYWL